MRELFHQDLKIVGDQLGEMTTLVHGAMSNATKSLLDQDLHLAESVIEDDRRVDALQVDLDERAIQILARQAPVAGDLRLVVGGLRMSASIERMGDLARHIAQLTRLRYPGPVLPESLVPTFVELGRLDVEITELTREFLATREPELGDRIVEDDHQVDDLHRSVFVAVARPDWHESAEVTVDVALASRFYERFADHAVSVAKKVNYLLTGDWDTDHAADPAAG